MILSHCCCCPGLATGGWQFWAAWPGSGVHGRGGRQVGQIKMKTTFCSKTFLSYLLILIHTLRLDDALDSYNQIRQSLAETQVILTKRPEDRNLTTWSRPRQRPCVSVGTSWTRTFLSWPRQSPPGALARWTRSIDWPLSDLHDRPGDHGEPWREYPHPERDVHWEKANDWGLWNFWG